MTQSAAQMVDDSPRIQLLGGLSITGVPGENLAFRTRKTTALFAYLALRAGDRHSRDFLCALFWPEANSSASRLSLRVALSSIRKALADSQAGDNLLNVDRDSIWIGGHCEVDAAEFEQACRRVFEVEAPEERLEAIGDAMALYSGPLVPGCEDSMLDAERQRLQEMAARLLRHQGQAYYKSEKYHPALESIERAIRMEPQAESSYRIGIRCHLALGQAESAKRLYRELTDMLAHDDRSAEPKTLRLAEQLESDSRVTPRVSAQVAVLASAASMPQPLTPFFGRQHEIEEVTQMLVRADGQTRLVTLLGLGGSGKTRLAVEIAKQFAATKGMHMVWVSLAGRQSMPDARATIAGAFEAEPNKLGPGVSRAVGEATCLLVLDNVDPLLHDSGDDVRGIILELLEATPHLRILAASRIPIESPGEVRYVVPPLQVPKAGSTLDELRDSPAVSLFVDRARRRLNSFEVTARTSDAVIEIVRRLDGLPLAVELAAMWVGAFSPEALVRRLNERFDLLATNEPTVDSRHKRLESVISASVEDLPDECERLFEKLCVLREPGSLEVVQALAGIESTLHVGALLSVLVERSVVWRQHRDEYDADLFIIPESLREYGVKRLAAAERQAAMQRLAAFLAVALSQAADDIRTDFLRVMRVVGPLVPILESVLAWCEEEGHATRGLELVTAFEPLWAVTGRQLVGRDTIARLLEAAGPIDAKLTAAALTIAARLSIEGGEILAAAPFVRRLRAVQLDDPIDACEAIALEAMVAGFELDNDGMAKCAAELEELMKTTDDPGTLARIVGHLAGLRRDLGDLQRACAESAEAVELAREAADEFRFGGHLTNHAFNLSCINDRKSAEAAITEAIAIARDSNHLAALAHRLWVYGCILNQQDEQTRSVWIEALGYQREIGNRQGMVWTLGSLAMHAFDAGRYDEYDAHVRERLKFAKAVNDVGAVKESLKWLIRSEVMQDRWLAAEGLAIELHRTGVPAGWAALERAWLAHKLGKDDSAREWLTKASTGEPDEVECAKLLLSAVNGDSFTVPDKLRSRFADYAMSRRTWSPILTAALAELDKRQM